MKVKNVLKKTLAVVLAFVMIAPLVGNLEVSVKEAKASETTSNVVSNDSLNVKFQATQGVVTETEIEAYKGKYVLRAVSAIQNPDAYDYIRFKAVRADKIEEGMTDDQIEALASEVKVQTVFKRIDSTTGSASGKKETYVHSPKVIDTNAEYFATAKFVIAEKNKDVDYVIWVCGSKNGTKVSGPKRQICVNDGLEACNTINMSFANDSGQTVNKEDVLSVTHTTTATMPAESNATATVIGVYGNEVSVRISGVTETKSANKFKFEKQDGTVLEDNAILRDHTITYNGNNADTSWYDVCQTSSADKFVIATSADLYGLAHLVNIDDTHPTFYGETIYLVSDITVNTGNASSWENSAPRYHWAPIGRKQNSSTKMYTFKGTFDAQMHTISGLYDNQRLIAGTDDNESLYGGLFGLVEGGTIKNLKLVNSYFTTHNNYLGSVVGYSYNATLQRVYSDATLNAMYRYVGGLVGGAQDVNMTECWFDGLAISTRSAGDVEIGGLLGSAGSNKTVNISDCLNTGTVSARPTNSNKAVYAGGLIGYLAQNGIATLYSSLNAGIVEINKSATYAYAIIGKKHDSATITTDENRKVYATEESNPEGNGFESDNVLKGSKVQYQGIDAPKTNMTFDFNTTWSTVPGNIPVLKCFESIVYDTSWYDKDESEFTLYDRGDLLGFATLSRDSANNGFQGKTIKLGADIMFNKGSAANWANTAPTYEWLTIGTETVPFKGEFDGANENTGGVHKISGLYIKQEVAPKDVVGLFGKTVSAKVQNIELEESYFYAAEGYIGSIAGIGQGTFQHIYSANTVTVTTPKNYAGGLVGATGSGGVISMLQCWFAGNVTGAKYVGGLVGNVVSSNKSNIIDCLNTGTVTANGENIGGIAGRVSSINTIKNVLHAGTVVSTSTTSVDPLIGNNGTSNSQGLYTTTASSKGTTISDTIGEAASTTLSGFDFTNTWKTVADSTPVLDFDKINEYILTEVTLNDFVALSKLVNFKGVTVKLAENIDAENDEDNQWTPISAYDLQFAGTFDGQGHKISNVYISSEEDYIGLFAAVAPEAVIKHFTLENSSISSTKRFVGAIAGAGKGTYSDIYVDADVTGSGRVGGFIGLSEKSGTLIMSNCSFNGTATCTGSNESNRIVGGLVGFVSGGSIKISNCLNSGTIDATAYVRNERADGEEPYVRPLAGGLVGFISGPKSVDIVSCLNVGDILVTGATTGVGPIVGEIYTDVVEHLSIIATYATTCDDKSGVHGVTMVDADVMKNDATSELDLLDWENQWTHEQGTFPQVRFSFTGFVEPESLEVQAALLDSLSSVYP